MDSGTRERATIAAKYHPAASGSDPLPSPVLRACKIALRNYRPAIYREPAALIRMSRRARRLQRVQNILRRLLCWELVIPELETLELQGRHRMLLKEPLVDEAAAFLRARLAALRNDRSEQ